jgi:hypothetical protein
MGIVAANAPEASVTRFEASVLAHLLELADETIFSVTCGSLEHRPEAMKW